MTSSKRSLYVSKCFEVSGKNICTPGSRRILKGVMPWHHRYIGNPLITWLLNTFYTVGVSDSQCGFRALTRQMLKKLEPSTHLFSR